VNRRFCCIFSLGADFAVFLIWLWICVFRLECEFCAFLAEIFVPFLKMQIFMLSWQKFLLRFFG
jgi:hypothetical protein